MRCFQQRSCARNSQHKKRNLWCQGCSEICKECPWSNRQRSAAEIGGADHLRIASQNDHGVFNDMCDRSGVICDYSEICHTVTIKIAGGECCDCSAAAKERPDRIALITEQRWQCDVMRLRKARKLIRQVEFAVVIRVSEFAQDNRDATIRATIGRGDRNIRTTISVEVADSDC